MTSFSWQEEMIICLLNSMLMTLLLTVKVKNNSGEPSHTINLTNQATETMDI